jgi:glycerol-3-phosphate acyltransferase PlsY
MNSWIIPSVLCAVAYLVGSIPFGLILAKLFAGADVRKAGSGNIGATNVARVVGPAAGLLTLVLDTAKGYVSVWLVSHFLPGHTAAAFLAGLFALFGHCFAIWLRFRGGKGVATTAGVILALCPRALFADLIVFVLVVVIFRFVSFASLSAAASLPLLMYLLWSPHTTPPGIVTFGALAMAFVVIYRHRTNIGRLARGEEPKFSLGKRKIER